jgi:hypothetical protein
MPFLRGWWFCFYFPVALPFHRSDDYRGDSNFNALFTPLTFLATYFNSGVNPLLYAILSRNFRKGMSELIICTFKSNKNKAANKRAVTHVSNLNSTTVMTHMNGDDNNGALTLADRGHQLNQSIMEYDSCNDYVET